MTRTTQGLWLEGKEVRCRDEEHGKGSRGQQLGEAAWRGRRGARARMGDLRTAVLE